MKKEESAALPARAELRAAKWTGARTFTIKLWAYLLPGTSKSATTEVEAWLQDDKGRRTNALVRPYTDPAANDGSSNPSVDVSGCAFEAVFDFDSHLAEASARGNVLTAHVSISDGRQVHESTLTNRYRWGSAGALEACGFENGVQVVPSWSADGLQFKIASRIAVAHAVSFVGADLKFWVKTDARFTPDLAVLRDDSEREVHTSSFAREGSWVEFAFNMADLPGLEADSPETWRFYLEAGEQRRLVHWNNLLTPVSEREDGLVLAAGPSGVVRLDRLQHNVEANAVDFYPSPNPHLTITGTYAGECSRPVSLSLEGQRDTLPGTLITNEAGRFIFSVPLVKPSETGPIAVPSGGYRVGVQFDDESYLRLRPAKALTASLYRAHYSERLNVRLERSPANEVYVNISPPLLPQELGEYNQRTLSSASRKEADLQPDSFYFESWFGKNFSDSPLALFQEARRRLPDAHLYVSVADLSVSLPDGAIPVVRNSGKSWKALAESKFVITNCWAPDRFERHPEQVLVQTWHGTPLKLLGLDRPGSRVKAGRVAKIEREANEWSLLVSQNPHSTEVFRKAYAYAGEIIQSGYPRNDALFDVDNLGHQVRESLNIPAGKTVVLYAPTWREDSAGSPDLIQAGAMADALGPDFTVLLRGHSVSLRRGQNVEAAGVIDVTSFNDPSGLMAAADVLVTDYSSIMFDFSVTGKPMIFFVPDWDDYTGSGRGVYFDLSDKAPGPLCHTREEVIEALKDLPEGHKMYHEAYAAWRKEFNPWDNPKSSMEVFSRILELRDAPAKG
ncbi:CDP-glycerol glycerophosphotransferase family protein [Arthrobacter sp. UYCu712]|uniref:CDP-glycerol glycerophosphotransferase family protein n=1 Tax=Arthrobacter sp. UYCu712 TaxID=3156340 RepID=UPI003398BF39